MTTLPNESAARILVVEDQEDLRQGLVDLLEDEGFTVGSSSDGEAALELLRSDSSWSVILFDLMMPKMDGFGFRGELLANPAYSKIPVIVLSGSSDVEGIAQVLRANGFLRKPFTPDELIGAVRHCTRQQSTTFL